MQSCKGLPRRESRAFELALVFDTRDTPTDSTSETTLTKEYMSMNTHQVDISLPQYQWVAFYEELAHKLLEYHDRQVELVDFLIDLRERGLMVTDLASHDFDYSQSGIDPFSFFASFNRGLTAENRRGIMEAMYEKFELHSPLPESIDFKIFEANAQNSVCFVWKSNDPKDNFEQISAVWDLFDVALDVDPFASDGDRATFIAAFDHALDTGVSLLWLTMGLSWMKPLSHLAVKRFGDSERDLLVLDDLGLEWSDIKGGEYLDCMKRTLEISDTLGLALPDINTWERPKHWPLPADQQPELYYPPELSWIPFHEEVAERLLKDDWRTPEWRDELADVIAEALRADPDPTENQLRDLREYDPYSLYRAFNQRSTYENRMPAYRAVKERLDIDADLPGEHSQVSGLSGFRISEFPAHLQDEDNRLLWNLFETALEVNPLGDQEQRDRFVRSFDNVIQVYGLRRVMPRWLYWIDPRKYIYINRFDDDKLGILSELGLGSNIRNGEDYVRCLGRAQEMADNAGISFAEMNLESATRESLGLPPVSETVPSYTIDSMLAEGVFLERDELQRMLRLLQSKKNLILQGPPGVGKTFIARKLAYALLGEKTEVRVSSVQFHQSYSYEDFVGGYRPDVNADDQMVFKPRDGAFLHLCKEAADDPDNDYVMLIDEINRGNLSRVFGELLMLIEADKRKPEHAVELQHRNNAERFYVPENVYIIGTMNLADRSLTGMNVAMRRRFGFMNLEPQFGEGTFRDWLADTAMPSEMQERIHSRMKELNDTIGDDASLGRNYAVGHSFFCPGGDSAPEGGWEEWYKMVVEHEIEPLLEEYWFDNQDKADEESQKLLAGDR